MFKGEREGVGQRTCPEEVRAQSARCSGCPSGWLGYESSTSTTTSFKDVKKSRADIGDRDFVPVYLICYVNIPLAYLSFPWESW